MYLLLGVLCLKTCQYASKFLSLIKSYWHVTENWFLGVLAPASMINDQEVYCPELAAEISERLIL